MELMNVIVEKFGGNRMAAIFRKYTVAVLLVQQLVFTLFIPDNYRPIEEPGVDKHEQVVTKEPFSSLNAGILQLLDSITHIESTVGHLLRLV